MISFLTLTLTWNSAVFFVIFSLLWFNKTVLYALMERTKDCESRKIFENENSEQDLCERYKCHNIQWIIFVIMKWYFPGPSKTVAANAFYIPLSLNFVVSLKPSFKNLCWNYELLELYCFKVCFFVKFKYCIKNRRKSTYITCAYPRQLEIDLWPWIIKVLKKSVGSSI